MAILLFVVAAVLFFLNAIKAAHIDENWPFFAVALGLALASWGYTNFNFFRRP